MKSNFLKYCLIGVTGVIVDFTVFGILNHFTDINIQIANWISSSLGLINNFILNVIYNFKVKDHLFSRFGKYYLIGLVGFSITAGILFVFVQTLHFNEYLVKIIATLFVLVIQFSLNQAVSFKKPTEHHRKGK